MGPNISFSLVFREPEELGWSLHVPVPYLKNAEMHEGKGRLGRASVSLFYVG